MTLKQLRYLVALADNHFSVSRTAEALHTTQPGVSKLARALEDEIGADLFVRTGNRLVDLTDAGRQAVELARRVVRDTRTIGSLRQSLQTEVEGSLRIGTTHIHACYSLVGVIRAFRAEHPGVEIVLRQGSPGDILQWVIEGAVDIGVSTLPASIPRDIVTFEAFAFERCVVVPRGHPLLKCGRIGLRELSRYPLIAYDDSYNSGWVVQHEFQRLGLKPRIAVRGSDANVIKSYVAAGVGIAVLQTMAFDPRRDRDIQIVPSSHLFPPSMSLVSVRRDHVLRPFGAAFVERLRGLAPARAAAQRRSRGA
jgi:LysR family cys regulon transcriptional activator